MLNIPMCFECKNKQKNYKCRAFPEGIPDIILFSEIDHIKPYPGDKDIQFEPLEDK